MKTDEALLWYCAKIEEIRKKAGHDAAKLEALSLAPALEREAQEKFPDDQDLYAQLKLAIELELPLAKRGIFLKDGPPTDEQMEELKRRNREDLRLLKKGK